MTYTTSTIIYNTDDIFILNKKALAITVIINTPPFIMIILHNIHIIKLMFVNIRNNTLQVSDEVT